MLERAVVLAEAAWARRHVTLAPEPPGDRFGLITSRDVDVSPAPSTASANAAARVSAPSSRSPVTAGADVPALHMVVVGDSMVAGCGTPNQAQGLVPNLAARLASTLRRSVAWEALGQLGATMRRVHYRLLPQVDSHPDLLVVCAGSNDVLAGRSTGEWADDLSAVLDMAREPARNVVVLSSGQANRCPALPRVLRREIGRAIDRQTAVSRDVCARRGIHFVDITHDSAPLRPGFWAVDNFHPSALGYQLVADAVVRRMPLPTLRPQTDGGK